MNDWKPQLRGDPLPWLLELDANNPGVRYFTLQELEGKSRRDKDVIAAQNVAMASGPIPTILHTQRPEGYWLAPGPGYTPKYTGTVWQVIFLAQLGADSSDPRVRAGCEYVLENARSETGGFSMTGQPAGMIHCLQGNLSAALLDFGYLGDERLASALDWLAHSITGKGIAPSEARNAPLRFLNSGTSAPGFVCSYNNHLPCAWGAVKALLALSKVPESYRSPVMREAIESGTFVLLRQRRRLSHAILRKIISRVFVIFCSLILGINVRSFVPT